MKRLNNLYPLICSVENLMLADSIARKGKLKQPGVIKHDANSDENIQLLHFMLVSKTLPVPEYTNFIIKEPKIRVISKLPYFPHRIAQHAIMNVLEPVFTAMFTADTYSCIKGRGIRGAINAVTRALKDEEGTKYCLKLDIQKFYPSIDHDILKAQLRRKFKDADLLWLLDMIIDSADGVPIGNYLSQYFANFYLTPFDHWIKQELTGELKVNHYFRYADDIVILSHSKAHLHKVLELIRGYLTTNLKLTIKGNYQVFPVEARGLDFVGIVSRHKYRLLRKSIKKAMARAYAKKNNEASKAAYLGWAMYCNSLNLMKKLTCTNSVTLKLIPPKPQHLLLATK